MSEQNPQTMLDVLEAWFKPFPSVLVAYSGGVDSALVMAAVHRVLGEKALACIGVSPSYPEREKREALALAQQMGAAVRIVDTEEHLIPEYAQNPEDRCFYCKNELYNKLEKIAHAEAYAVIVDGNNGSDLGDFRPGREAAARHGVRSPLVELGFAKEHVRAMAKILNLPVWDKPAMACLSSRVPHGTPIMPGLLHQIEAAEDALAAMGFRQFRVRHYGEMARIELMPEDFPRALELREILVEKIREAGYRFVTLDLAGFRSGGLHGVSSTASARK